MAYSYRPSRGVYRRRWRPLPRQKWVGTLASTVVILHRRWLNIS